MMVPVRVPVAGKMVKLDYVEELHDEKGHPIFGETVESDLHVKISRSRPLSADQVWATVFHELAHVALEAGGVSQVLGDRREEAVAHCLDNLLAPLLAFRKDVPGMKWRDIPFNFEERD